MTVRPWVLCGVKHCGKTTQGRMLAKRLGWKFSDTDALVEKRYFDCSGEKKSCREIFAGEGGDFFRRLEAETVGALAGALGMNKKQVIALGGGVLGNPYIPETVLRALGRMIYLAIDAETAYRRIAVEGLPPFLAKEPAPAEKFREMCDARAAICEKYATITVNSGESDDPETVFAQLLDAIGKQGI